MLTAALALLPNLASVEPLERMFPHYDDQEDDVYDVFMGIERHWFPARSRIQKATLVERPFVATADSTSPDAACPLAPIIIALGLARRHIQ